MIFSPHFPKNINSNTSGVKIFLSAFPEKLSETQKPIKTFVTAPKKSTLLYFIFLVLVPNKNGVSVP